MNYLKQTFQNKFYTYQPGEFLPVFMGGELYNRREFYKYKLKRVLKRATGRI